MSLWLWLTFCRRSPRLDDTGLHDDSIAGGNQLVATYMPETGASSNHASITSIKERDDLRQLPVAEPALANIDSPDRWAIPEYRSGPYRLVKSIRASELLHLTVSDVHLGTGAHVSCLGKGRKQRITPLTTATARMAGRTCRPPH